MSLSIAEAAKICQDALRPLEVRWESHDYENQLGICVGYKGKSKEIEIPRGTYGSLTELEKRVRSIRSAIKSEWNVSLDPWPSASH